MATESTPRINAAYLEQFTNHAVRIVGKVLGLHGQTATLDAGGSINIHLNRVRGSMLPFSSGQRVSGVDCGNDEVERGTMKDRKYFR